MRLTKTLIALSFTLFLFGCGATKYSSGDRFYVDIYASGKDPFYVKEGIYQGKDFYTVLPRWQKFEAQAGLLVNKDIVVQSLTQADVDKIRASFAEEKRVAQEQQRVAKLKSEQDAKQLKLKDELAEQNRIKELKSRSYSMLPAKLQVRISTNGYGIPSVVVTSIDDSPFLLERVVVNNKPGVKDCDKGGYAEYLTTGDARSIPAGLGNCGNTIVKVDVYTNRGSSSYQFR